MKNDKNVIAHIQRCKNLKSTTIFSTSAYE